MSSKRSHSVASDSSGDSRCSHFSSSSETNTTFKRGRSRSRVEQEYEERLVVDLADILFEYAVNDSCESQRTPEEKEVPETDPLPDVFLNYINAVTTSSGTKVKPKSFMKDVIDEELDELFNIREENPSDKRIKFLEEVKKDKDEEDENSVKYTIYTPLLTPETCYAEDAPTIAPEDSSRLVLLKYIHDAQLAAKNINFSLERYIEQFYPMLYYSYMGDAKKVIEIVADCDVSKGTSSVCNCYDAEGQWHWSPLAIAACHGNIAFIKSLDNAAATKKHLRALMYKFVWPILNSCNLPFFACESNHFEMLKYLYSSNLIATYRGNVIEEVPDIWDEISLGYPYSLAAVATANKNMEMLRYFFNPQCSRTMKDAELSRLILEAVNTDDVEFTEYILEHISYFLYSQNSEVSISGVMRHNVGRADQHGVRDTAFHRAIVRENPKMLEMLRQYDGYRSVVERDANGLTPQYFALSVGMKEVFDSFESDTGLDANHVILSCDIGLETNQEELCEGLVKNSFVAEKYVSYFLRKSITCLCLKITEKLVEKILLMDVDEKTKTRVLSDAVLIALDTARRMTLSNHKSSEAIASIVKKLTDCVAMLINAGALVPYNHHRNFPPETVVPEVYEIFRRLMYREEVDLRSAFVPMEHAVVELLDRRLSPVPPSEVPNFRDLRPHLFPDEIPM